MNNRNRIKLTNSTELTKVKLQEKAVSQVLNINGITRQGVKIQSVNQTEVCQTAMMSGVIKIEMAREVERRG